MKALTIGDGTCCDNAEKLRAANQRIATLEQIATEAIHKLDDISSDANCNCGHSHCSKREARWLADTVLALKQRLKGEQL